MTNSKSMIMFAAGAISVFLLSGCGSKIENEAATQVIARIDSKAISLAQLNAVLKDVGTATSEYSTLAKRRIVDKLVEQQLAINMAIENKLDRAPQVVDAIEAAKREILAQAYLEQVIGKPKEPSPEEVREYFNDNPELFTQRRVYSLHEIILKKDEPELDAVREKVAGAGNMDEVAAWLKEKKIEFGVNGGTRAAEQIPLEILPKVHQMKDGEMSVIIGDEAAFVIRVIASQPQPVDEARAMPRIQQYLVNRRIAQIVDDEIKSLKAKAKIEYFGEFAAGDGASAIH